MVKWSVLLQHGTASCHYSYFQTLSQLFRCTRHTNYHTLAKTATMPKKVFSYQNILLFKYWPEQKEQQCRKFSVKTSPCQGERCLLGPWDQHHMVPSGEFSSCSTASRELFLLISKRCSVCVSQPHGPPCPWHKRRIHFSTWPDRWGERACSLTEIKDVLIREERGENAIASNTNLHLSSTWRSFQTEWQSLVPFLTEHQINTLMAAPEQQLCSRRDRQHRASAWYQGERKEIFTFTAYWPGILCHVFVRTRMSSHSTMFHTQLEGEKVKLHLRWPWFQ